MNPEIKHPELAALFPDVPWEKRTSLAVWEIAPLLRVTRKHVIELIEEGSLQALDCSSGPDAAKRRAWRVPVPDFARFIRERASNADRMCGPEVQQFTKGRR